MNQNFNQMQVRFPRLGCWLFILGTIWLIGAIGIGGIIKSVLALVLFIVLAPVLAFLALQFWIKRNLVNGSCPVCEQTLAGLKNTQIACPNCGTNLSVTSEGFERFAAEGVIDIQAVDVPSGPVKLADAAATRDRTTIDVEVQQLPDGDG
ncbi:MAG: hypothetical protein HLUCCA11_17280 [Phormidesmis priestleyi Ana]|uniref:Uncharacterized protein n=1 Tax=Phormidesmis priestleyi Ana TaxID=1666911 RepID=A0A0P7ZU04_9CYAN|nr:MAG: hypothetical protein HLUCCA11_17280 [Phormidesmis priestleyi Ana]